MHMEIERHLEKSGRVDTHGVDLVADVDGRIAELPGFAGLGLMQSYFRRAGLV
jgi:hypothetical protein